MRGTLATILAAAALVLVCGSSPLHVVRGSVKELRGVRKISVITNDVAKRDVLGEALRAAIPEVEVVADPGGADAMLVVTFSSESVEEAPEASNCGCPTCADARRSANPTQAVTRAVASVVRPAGPNAYRKLASSNWSHPSALVVCRQVAEHFALTWRKANRK